MVKVVNTSIMVIGLMISTDKLRQVNLMPGAYIVVEKATKQMFRLADPSIGLLSLKLVGGV